MDIYDVYKVLLLTGVQGEKRNKLTISLTHQRPLHDINGPIIVSLMSNKFSMSVKNEKRPRS